MDSKDLGLPTSSSGFASHKDAGLGLLSRLLGGVFLILVCGLLLLDRALLQANQDQTDIDAQAASLLTEQFIAREALFLEKIASDESDALVELLRKRDGIIAAWAEDSVGARTILFESTSHTSLQLPRATNAPVAVVPISGHNAILLRQTVVHPVPQQSARQSITVLINAKVLEREIKRLDIPSRVTLSVVAGSDTLVSLGDPAREPSALTGTRRTVRLPNGGAWTVATTHALASRTLRWALWILGILGVGFLAYGLLKEQRRALQAAGRSSELERLYSDVKRANQAKSEFLANVSHELRTPLNAIVGFVELLREGFYGDLTPRQVPPVDRIAASATHLRHLVDQVLDIAKIAAGRLEVHAETIVLRPFVLNIASELESLVSEKNLAFSITVGASLPRVRTDPSHLRQILINLIGNAVKYTQLGTISIRARLLLETVAALPAGSDPARQSDEEPPARSPRPGSWIALQVVDTGVGIARDDLHRIFDEFEQVNAGPRGDSIHRGTGLGLAISRRLARLLGGEITVESEPGKGSTFTVWLPVNVADLNRDPVVAPVQPEIATA